MKQSKIKIAVTGGIGSGKTTVCSIIKEMGYPVFSCDEVYAELLYSGKLTEGIVEEFGKEVLTDGKIDRRKLSACVFGDENKLKKLNEITHPKIFEEMFARAENLCGLVIFEVPLLFEGGYQNLFDEVVVVLRAVEDRILSVKLRDKLSDEEVVSRIKKQLNYDIFNFAQYYVIHNQGKIDNMSDIITELLLKIALKYQN